MCGELTSRIVDKSIFFSFESGSVAYQQVERVMALVGEAEGLKAVAVTVHAMPGQYEAFALTYFSLPGETNRGEDYPGTDIPARLYYSGGFATAEAYVETADGFGIRALLIAEDGNTELTVEQTNDVLNAVAAATKYL